MLLKLSKQKRYNYNGKCHLIVRSHLEYKQDNSNCNLPEAEEQ